MTTDDRPDCPGCHGLGETDSETNCRDCDGTGLDPSSQLLLARWRDGVLDGQHTSRAKRALNPTF